MGAGCSTHDKVPTKAETAVVVTPPSNQIPGTPSDETKTATDLSEASAVCDATAPAGAAVGRDFAAERLIQPRVPERMQIVPYEQLEKTFENAMMLGEGGFGVVWEIEWQGRALAVKKLNMSRKNAIAGDFIREVIVLGTMSHPNIVQLAGVSQAEDAQCLMYELMGGGSLADRLALCEAGGDTEMTTGTAEGREGGAMGEEEDFIMPFLWQDRIQVACLP